MIRILLLTLTVRKRLLALILFHGENKSLYRGRTPKQSMALKTINMTALTILMWIVTISALFYLAGTVLESMNPGHYINIQTLAGGIGASLAINAITLGLIIKMLKH